MVLVAIGAMAVFPSIVSASVDRLATLGQASYESNSDRVELWRGIIAETVRRPEGSGAASFADTLTPRIGRHVAQLGHAHSNYLEVAFFYGWFGLALYLGMLAAMWRVLRRRPRAGGQQAVLVAVARPSSGPRAVTAAYGALTAYMIDSVFENTWASLNVTATLFLLVGLGAGRQALLSAPTVLPKRDGASVAPRIPA